MSLTVVNSSPLQPSTNLPPRNRKPGRKLKIISPSSSPLKIHFKIRFLCPYYSSNYSRSPTFFFPDFLTRSVIY
ncbi:hypothetical protein GQ457_11G002060 [Hibiscus cannabinus]